MSTKGISMRKLTQIIRLHFDAKLSTRQIAKSLNLSIGAVNKYTKRAVECELNWPLPPEMNDAKLAAILTPSSTKSNKSTQAGNIDFAKIHHELKRKGLTLQLLWDEYHAEQANALSYSRYCHHYRVYKQSLKRSMRQTHTAGDKVFIDYSGATVSLLDPETNEVRTAEVFVGVLGASKYTYAEATWTQQLPDFLGAQRRMFEFFGGTPALVVPDNLRSAVSKTCRYEPDINPSYAQFIDYYGTAVLPARPYRPKDKALVESGVQIVQRWILARLRHQTFVGLAELNVEIRRLLAALNQKPFQKLSGCRHSVFLELDKPALKPLPLEAYEYRQYKSVRVGVDYHVSLDGHYYSVPHRYCGEVIELWFNQHTVECYSQGNKIATHIYSSVTGQHSTIIHHMPKSHQKQSEYSKERFIRWSKQIGIYTHLVIKRILEEKAHPEQAYRSCLGLLRLTKKYGDERLEQACTYGVNQKAFSRKNILSILKNNLDQLATLSDEYLSTEACSFEHENIRGSHYYH